MKKILSIALVAILAAGSAFATFSGDASVAFGYNWETGKYGFSNGTGLDFEIDVATADAEKIAEGDVYAGIKANFALKVGNWKFDTALIEKALTDSENLTEEEMKQLEEYMKELENGNLPLFGLPIIPVDGGFETAGLGVFAEVEEAYVAGENWKVSILGTQGAPDFAKSAIDTKKGDVKDIFGNKYDTEDVAVSYKVASEKAAGITATVYDWTASVGLKGNSKTDEFAYNAFVQTPEFDFDVVTLQVAAIASQENGKDSNVGASAKVGFDADIVAGSVAADFGFENLGLEGWKAEDNIKLDVAANLAISPITLDVYFANKVEDIDNLLSAQVKVDLNAFEVPVALTVAGKDLINKQDLSAKAEMTFGAVAVTAKTGYVIEDEKFSLGAEVGYTHDLFAVKAGADWSCKFADVENTSVLSAKASIESSAIIPGATLSLAYDKDSDVDMNLLDGHYGKIEAKCKITF